MTHASKFITHFNKAIEDVFGTTFTKTRRTVTVDQLGYTSDESTAMSTVYGDFQRITDERELQELGLVGVGSAKFYGKTGQDILEGDLLTVSSELWQFRRRIDVDELQGTEVAVTYLLVRIDG